MVCAALRIRQARPSGRLLVFAFAFLFLEACRAPSGPATSSSAVHLAIAFAQPASLRNSAARDLGINQLVSLLSNDRLLNLGTDGRPGPGLVDRWERSGDGLTWRFFLRPNLTFHDGTPIDAPHLVKALAPAVGPTVQAPGLRPVIALTADDPLTLVFHLDRPSSLLPDELNVLSVTAGGPAGKASPAGPFEVVSRDKEQVHLRAFDRYFRGRPTIDTIDLREYPNARNAWSAMMRGEVDFLFDVAPEAIDFIEQSSRAQIKTSLRPYVFAMGMNMRHPVLRRREVRIALNHAVNRTRILDVVFRGRGYPASSHVWPRHWAYDHLLSRFRFLPQEASQMLDAAALPRQTTPGSRGPARFSFVCLVPAADLRYERIALMLQQQLNDVGVDMHLQMVAPLEMIKRMRSGDYDAVLLDIISTTGLNFVYTVWHSPQGGPVYLFDSGYTGLDSALDRLQVAQTDEDTRAAVHDVQQVMHEDPPAIFICWSERARAVSSRFLLPAIPDRDIYATLAQWRLAPGAATDRSP
jgi:peptide/nickel transport system substrate-binding protein